MIRLKVENVSKQYRLGEIGSGTIAQDLNRFWAKIRGKEDPTTIVGVENDRTLKTDEDFVWALKEINFEVKQGEILGIIGRNGAGKSTLLKILSKVTGPTTGKIKINGRIGALLEVGTGMHPELTGIENIYLNGAILGMTKKEIKAKIDEIIDFAGIAKYAETPFKRYSSGMRVRLGFAVAAFLEPEILIVDEVLAVGDAEFQKKAIGKMKNVSQGEGRTVLFVSHNMGSIKTLCNRAIILENGTVKFQGDTNECISKYLSMNSNSELNLLKTTNRNGNGNLKFSKISFFNKKNSPIKEVLSDGFLKIRIDFITKKNIDFNKIIIALNFRDDYENNVLSFITDEMGKKVVGNNKNCITLTIPKLKLRGGKYNIRLLAMDGSTNKDSFLDEIDVAATIEVLSTDYWKIGKTLRNQQSAFSNGDYLIEY